MQLDLFTVVAQLVNFLILVWLLRRFLYGPIVRSMQERERRIAERLQHAADAERDANAARDEAQHQRDALDERREELLASARAAAETHKRELFDEARDEAAELRERWAAAIERERKTYLDELRERAGRRVFAIAERVLRELADVEVERRIVERFLERLAELPKLESTAPDAPRPSAIVHSGFVIPNELERRLREQLRALAGADIDVRFGVDPEVVAGIEVSLAGRRIAWSVRDYLESLDEVFRARTAAPEEVLRS